MTKIYAKLIGSWVCLNDDPECVINHQSPVQWWKEGGSIWNRKTFKEDTMYQTPYVNILFKGKNYRINPTVHIQIVTES